MEPTSRDELAGTPTRAARRRADAQRGGLVRRRRILGGVIGGTLVLTGVGAAAATVLKSPAQVAAETAPPPPDVLTVPVEKRVLSTSLVTRGKVAAARRVEVLSAGLSGPDTMRPVVTKVLVKPGDAVRAGAALVEVAGRPVLALNGSLPAYRNLGPGSVGKDVEQVQRGLSMLGYRRGGDAPGTFGPGTQRAVRSLYRAAGYAAQAGAPDGPGPTGPGTGKPGEKPAGRTSSTGRTSTGRTSSVPTEAGSAGVVLPASEIVFLGDGPARVESVDAVVGATAGEKLLTLTAGALMVDGSLEAYQKQAVRPGQQVEIFAETTGGRATGTVVAVTAAPAAAAKDAAAGSGAGAAPGYVVKIEPAQPLPADFAGQNVRLTIRAASSQGEVLVVPASAVSSGADGRTTLTTVSGGGRQTRIEVRVGMTGDGSVEVIPVQGSLRVGDRVVVGAGPTTAVGGGTP
ncbi:peptidoglycan-binding protein [Streptomyces sp. NPDC093225]|uniref:peptidoglycan-binding protein n=1 Tax=Streptomyces sp. NPDC093225 TaxID=3366034 RepID=UPI0037F5F407